MGRLFAGTPWDRPPTCERCGRLEPECTCPPADREPVRIPPEKQTARLRIEKRPKGKVVTVVANLDPEGNDLPALAARLKAACGSGGTVKESGSHSEGPSRKAHIEIQGDHLARAEAELTAIGYKTRRG